MLQKYLIFFVLSNFTCQSSRENDYVSDVNYMLANPYWRDGLKEFETLLGEYPQFNIFYKTNKAEHINGRTFFRKLNNDKYVNENNFKEKVIQYHFLLSCYYGMELKFYLFYVKELCILCKRLEPEFCQTPLNHYVNFFIKELTKMKNSLLHLCRWLDDLDLKNDIYEVIDRVIVISRHITLVSPDNTIKNLHDEYHNIKHFFDISMKPWIGEEEMNTRLTVNYQNLDKNLSFQNKVFTIFQFFHKAIKHTLNMINNLGFFYDDKLDCLGVRDHKESPSTPLPQVDEDD